jgi:hypothetical protein
MRCAVFWWSASSTRATPGVAHRHYGAGDGRPRGVIAGRGFGAQVSAGFGGGNPIWPFAAFLNTLLAKVAVIQDARNVAGGWVQGLYFKFGPERVGGNAFDIDNN